MPLRTPLSGFVVYKNHNLTFGQGVVPYAGGFSALGPDCFCFLAVETHYPLICLYTRKKKKNVNKKSIVREHYK